MLNDVALGAGNPIQIGYHQIVKRNHRFTEEMQNSILWDSGEIRKCFVILEQVREVTGKQVLKGGWKFFIL